MTKRDHINLIEEALTEIRPFLKKDEGDITFVDLTDDMIVKVALHGACRDCSMSAMTLKAGVEEQIRNLVPGVKKVVAVPSL